MVSRASLGLSQPSVSEGGREAGPLVPRPEGLRSFLKSHRMAQGLQEPGS